MSSIEALTTWNDGVIQMEKKNYDQALTTFEASPEMSAKILFNCAICNFVKSDYQAALKNMTGAVQKDEHLAIGYHLKGILHFKLKQFDQAVSDFETSFKKLRGKNVIDYNQLGCRYKFYAFEPLYNCGVSWSKQRSRPKALDYLLQAQRCKIEKKHEIVEDVILKVDQEKSVDILPLPTDTIFRPPKSKLANIKKKDYLGKAKVISAVDTSDVNIVPGFEAPRKMSLGIPALNQNTHSAPNSPNVKRRNPSAADIAADAKQTSAATAMKPSRSANDLRSLASASRKALPPPPQKPAPTPPASLPSARPSKPLPLPGQSSSRKNKPLPVPTALGSGTSGRSERQSKPLPRPSNRNEQADDTEIPQLPPRRSSSPTRDNDRAPALPPSRRQPPRAAEVATLGSVSSAGASHTVRPVIDLTKCVKTRSPAASPTADHQTAEHVNELQSVADRIKRLQTKDNSSNAGAASNVGAASKVGAASNDSGRAPLKPPRISVTDDSNASSSPSSPPTIPPRNENNAAEPTNSRGLPPRAKQPGSSSGGGGKRLVSVELTCNDTTKVKLPRGTSLAELCELACDEFNLEPGTIDLWYKTGSNDEDYDVINDEDDMTRVWAAVTDRLALYCFSKQA